MTPEEAIKILEKKKEYSERITDNFLDYSMGEIKEADQTIEICDMAISVIKEIQQYREIGTVEECREAMEKQKAKKPEYINNGISVCRECGHKLKRCYDYCPECGQAIQWYENLEGMEDER